jgi:hypothetical protein
VGYGDGCTSGVIPVKFGLILSPPPLKRPPDDEPSKGEGWGSNVDGRPREKLLCNCLTNSLVCWQKKRLQDKVNRGSGQI